MSPHRLITSLTILGLVGCTHDVTPPTELKVQKGNDTARENIRNANFADARSDYQAVLDIQPENIEANVGWSIADILLLPDSAPVADVLAKCGENTLNVEREIFGATGLLARFEEARQGLSTVALGRAENINDTAIDLTFAPTTITSKMNTFNSRRELFISLKQGGPDGATIYLAIDPDDIDDTDTVTTPLATGTTIQLDRFAGYFGVYTHAENGTNEWSSAPMQGTATFVEYGPNEGDRIVLEFTGAEHPAACAASPCNAVFRFSGRVEDTISGDLIVDQRRVPFGTANDDPGPPQRNSFIVALERCDDIDRPFLAQKLVEFGDLLEANSNHLAVVIRSAAAEQVRYVVPRGLLHVRTDLTLNIVDIRMLKTALDIASAGIELAAQYKYAEGRIQDMITDYCRWADEDGDEVPECHNTRDFSKMALFINYEANFLDRTATFDLTKVRSRLTAGLEAGSLALRGQSMQQGVFDFQVPAVATLSNELAEIIEALQTSIDSPTPVAIPTSPLYEVHLGAFFANPLDRSRLLMLSGLNTLVGYEAGNPTSAMAWERNDRWWIRIDELVEDIDSIPVVTGQMVTIPPENLVSCTPMSCATGYACSGSGVCERAWPRAVDPSVWDRALSSGAGDWPVIISRSIEGLFE